MSYDVYLESDGCCSAHWHNITTNVAPMWRLAGIDLSEVSGSRAADVLPLLVAAIGRMEADPAPYRALEPGNGWGDYSSCLRFLRDLREVWMIHPNGIVRVSK